MTRPLSGDQYVLRGHGYEARVAGVGATLRSLRHAGRDLVVPFAADELRPAMRGALLAPWPNRTGDGRYTYDGVSHQLPLTEPGLGHAAHGLAAWLGFRLVRATRSRVLLTGTLEPQPGYPWRVRLDVEHALGEDGLTQRVTATDESRQVAPFGVGGHPYLVAGPSGRDAVDGWTLELPARTALLTDERLLPVREVDVAQHAALDFRRPRRIGPAVLNHAWTDLVPGPDGRTRVRVLDATGRGAELVADARCRWVQVYTADHQDGDDRRSGLAVEPMTCPPDALRSGRDLVALEPGRPWTTGWTIRAVG